MVACQGPNGKVGEGSRALVGSGGHSIPRPVFVGKAGELVAAADGPAGGANPFRKSEPTPTPHREEPGTVSPEICEAEKASGSILDGVEASRGQQAYEVWRSSARV